MGVGLEVVSLWWKMDLFLWRGAMQRGELQICAKSSVYTVLQPCAALSLINYKAILVHGHLGESSMSKADVCITSTREDLDMLGIRRRELQTGFDGSRPYHNLWASFYAIQRASMNAVSASFYHLLAV